MYIDKYIYSWGSCQEGACLLASRHSASKILLPLNTPCKKRQKKRNGRKRERATTGRLALERIRTPACLLPQQVRAREGLIAPGSLDESRRGASHPLSLLPFPWWNLSADPLDERTVVFDTEALDQGGVIRIFDDSFIDF